jgi:CDP-diacylglycerol--glycerol-3-phosphate 3-phosphatidyltransferase
MEKYKGNIITFPNILSFSRIMLSPIIFIVKENKTLLFSVLLLIGLTDILDGYIARKNKIRTIIGSWLDSLADFIFYILLVVYLILFEINVVNKMKYYVLIIITLKLFTIIICFTKHREIGFLHTLGNKITGLIIFIGFCIFILLKDTIVINIGIIISIISSLEESMITIVEKKYESDIKGIWEIKKLKK